MSHFTEVAVDMLAKNEKCLVEALEEMYGKGHVEVSADGLDLFGYHRDNRNKLPKTDPNYAPKCNVVVRQQYVGQDSNDIGYYRTEDGKYKLIVSDYDKGGNFSAAKQKQVKQGYTASVTQKQLKAQGYKVSMSKDKAGNLKITASKYSK